MIAYSIQIANCFLLGYQSYGQRNKSAANKLTMKFQEVLEKTTFPSTVIPPRWHRFLLNGIATMCINEYVQRTIEEPCYMKQKQAHRKHTERASLMSQMNATFCPDFPAAF